MIQVDKLDSKDKGLTTAKAKELLKQYGPNFVSEKKSGILKKFLAPLYSPISLMLLAAAALSFFDHKIFDFYFILGMYFVNYGIQKWQEFKADRAIQELQSQLSFDVHTLRDGQWMMIDAKLLVPGDQIRLGLGSIVPADGIVSSSRNLSISEAVLTGESMPKEKSVGDKIFSGSYITTGNLEASITTTGRHTSFGKTIFSIEEPTEKSLLEKDILSISHFLMVLSLIAVAILTIVFLLRGFQFVDVLTLDLSLIIAGIPIAMPAVMAVILSIGATGLGKKQVVVRRLSALQDLANVNLVLSDKTGTLTKNEISVTKVVSYETGMTGDDVIELAYLATSTRTPNTIDTAIATYFKTTGRNTHDANILKSIPFDSDRKRSTAWVEREDGELVISLGAPQIIEKLDSFESSAKAAQFTRDIDAAAHDGFRVLAVAHKQGGGEEVDMTVVGLIYLTDPLDETSKDTIAFMLNHGISVKMVTGDNRVIAARIAGELGLSGRVVPAAETRTLAALGDALSTELATVGAFAEILPKDKYELVQACEPYYVVASTGDGINDLPALKVANVGIAVAGAVSALKSLADIVLLGHGLGLIRDAILESRKIFTRLYNYSVYRISESFRLIVTILILGLLYGSYPLVPLQIIILAFLNDIPIISLAVDKVKISSRPSTIKTKERLVLSVLFGFVGVLNSLILFFIMKVCLHLPLDVIQTIFFLKLAVSGHLLVFVVHTKERWWKYLPARQVMWAIFTTQGIATTLAVTGFLMPAAISWQWAVIVWVWSFLWMQIGEVTKYLQARFLYKNLEPGSQDEYEEELK